MFFIPFEKSKNVQLKNVLKVWKVKVLKECFFVLTVTLEFNKDKIENQTLHTFVTVGYRGVGGDRMDQKTRLSRPKTLFVLPWYVYFLQWFFYRRYREGTWQYGWREWGFHETRSNRSVKTSEFIISILIHKTNM